MRRSRKAESEREKFWKNYKENMNENENTVKNNYEIKGEKKIFYPI